MGKRLLSLTLILALILGLVPATAGAAGEARITCGDGTAAAGQYVSVSLRAEDLEALASLDLEVFYDPDVLELSWQDQGELLDGAVVSINTAEPGVVRLSAANPGGITGSGTLLWLEFYVTSDAAPGTYPLTVAAGDAYDAALNPAAISAESGSVTVTDTPPTNGEFRLGLSLSTDSLLPGETLTAAVVNEWGCGFASCDLVLTYDETRFRVKNANVSGEIENAVYSLNTEKPGQVRLSCASAAQLWCWELLTVELEALTGGTTRLTASATDVYDENRIPYAPGSAEAEVTIRSAEPQPQPLPRVLLEAAQMIVGQESSSTLILEAGSNLAAADFRLEYDPELLECLEVESAVDAGMVVINPNFGDGLIRFSYVNEAGATGETALVTIRWRAKEGADRHFTVTTALIDPVDPELEPVLLNCPALTGCIYHLERLEPTCTEAGGEALVCGGCGDRINLEAIDPLGHDYGAPEFRWAADYSSCTAQRICRRDGGHIWSVECAVTVSSEGGSCTEPGSISYTAAADFGGEVFTDSVTLETERLGHDYAWSVHTEPGCETEGLRQGICTRCGDTLEEPIAALGHDWEGISCTRCGAVRENPFTDVPEGSFYYDPVIWAVSNGITNGTTPTTFGPNDQCMRAHVVTFLWRAAGSPEPGSDHNPFTDVKPTDFYYKAVLWAVEKGITNGTTATTFGPTAYCNRAQVVTFLYRAMGNPAVSSAECPFTDVAKGAWYEMPILWAVENGITNGIGGGLFGVTTICNRAQIVTFLYRAFT